MINVNITHIILSPTPSANVVATLDYRCIGSTGAFILLSNQVVVQPNGQLVTPYLIQFDESVCTDGIELRAQANCGGGVHIELVEQITTTSTTQPVITTTSSTTAPVITTTSSTTQPPVTTTSSTTQPAITTTSSTTQPAITTTSTTTQPGITTTSTSSTSTTSSSTTQPPITTTSTTTTPPITTTSTTTAGVTTTSTSTSTTSSTSTSTTKPPTTSSTTTSTTQPPITTTSTTTPAPEESCPECEQYGFESSADGTRCFKYEVTTPVSNPSGELYTKDEDQRYSIYGSFIYSSFNLSGRGPGSYIPFSNSFWVNGDGWGNGTTAARGPMNRSAVWSNVTRNNQDVGFTACINAPTTKTYYVGVGTDNFATVRVDGVLLLNQGLDIAGLDADHGTNLRRSTFYVWHIYPITVTAGEHIIEVIAHNVEDVAGVGVEIYDNTPAQIIAATSYANLNVIFKSQDVLGQPVQVGTGGSGYTCPNGWALDLCHGAARCVKLTSLECADMATYIPTTTTTVTTQPDCPDIVGAETSGSQGCNTYTLVNRETSVYTVTFKYTKCDGTAGTGTLVTPEGPFGASAATATVCSLDVPTIVSNYDVTVTLNGTC